MIKILESEEQKMCVGMVRERFLFTFFFAVDL